MPTRLYAGLILAVLLAAGVTVALFHWFGALGAAITIPLVLLAALAVRR